MTYDVWGADQRSLSTSCARPATADRLRTYDRLEKDFVGRSHTPQAWERNGAPTSSVFHRRRRNGQPHGGGQATAVHIAAFAEPADPGPGRSGRRRTAIAQR